MSNPDEQDPFSALLAEAERRIRVKGEISKITQSCSMKSESEILMNTWQYLGDHTETYFEAMQACGSIIAINREIEKNLAGFEPHVIIKILETLSLLTTSQADCQKQILEKMNELNGATPHVPEP